jgi:outer membrane protein TolC
LAKSNLEVSLAELDNAISNTVYGLNINLGLPEETILVTDETSAIYTPDTAGMAGGLAQSHSFRDEIKAQEIREKALTYQLKSVKGNYFPTLSLGANYYLNNPNQRVFPLENKFKATWDLGATLNWNFTQLYTSKANVREAKANLEQAKVGKKQLEDGIKLESRQTLNAWKLCQRKISLAQLTIEQAIENQRIVQNRFNNNTALATDLLDADNALVQAKLNLLNAKADASAAYYKALRVAGK